MGFHRQSALLASPLAFLYSLFLFFFGCLPQRRAPSAALRPYAVGLGPVLWWTPWLHHVKLNPIVVLVTSHCVPFVFRPPPPARVGPMCSHPGRSLSWSTHSRAFPPSSSSSCVGLKLLPVYVIIHGARKSRSRVTVWACLVALRRGRMGLTGTLVYIGRAAFAIRAGSTSPLGPFERAHRRYLQSGLTNPTRGSASPSSPLLFLFRSRSSCSFPNCPATSHAGSGGTGWLLLSSVSRRGAAWLLRHAGVEVEVTAGIVICRKKKRGLGTSFFV